MFIGSKVVSSCSQCNLWEGRSYSFRGGHTTTNNSKCLPVLLYGLEACPLTKSDLHSLDFVINRFFMKLFKTSNIETVKKIVSSFLALKYPVLYGPNVSISLNLNLQSSLALISLLAGRPNRITYIYCDV